MITDLYKTIKNAILTAKPCPDGAPNQACPSCLAQHVADTLQAPVTTDEAAAAGDIRIFNAKEVQEVINAAITLDRECCKHEQCDRTSPTGFVLVPLP